MELNLITRKNILIFLRDEAKRVVRLLVPLRFLSGRKSDLFPRDLFVRNCAEEMRDAIQSRTPFVVRLNDIPW